MCSAGAKLSQNQELVRKRDTDWELSIRTVRGSVRTSTRPIFIRRWKAELAEKRPMFSALV